MVKPDAESSSGRSAGHFMVLSRVTALQDSERRFSLSTGMAGRHTASAREQRRLMIEPEKCPSFHCYSFHPPQMFFGRLWCRWMRVNALRCREFALRVLVECRIGVLQW